MNDNSLERHTPLLELVEQHIDQGYRCSIREPIRAGWFDMEDVGNDGLEHDADPVPAHLAIVHIVGWT